MKIVPAVLLMVWSTAVVSSARAGAGFVDRARGLDAPLAYADGAPPGFSGAVGEDSCHACHFHADINSRPGHVVIDGVPDRFVAGQSYPLTVTVQRPGMRAAGFQLSVRFKDGGGQAGSLAVGASERERLKVDMREAVQYVNQRRTGTAPTSPDAARWTVMWTAPGSGGAVQFHVAANAADNDESASGDYVFTAVVESASAVR